LNLAGGRSRGRPPCGKEHPTSIRSLGELVGGDAVPRSVTVAARLVSFAVVCAALYWAQVVLIPLALAALFAFVLSPAVARVQRLHVPRIAAVLIVAVLATASVGGLGWVLWGEAAALTDELPAYRANIRAKIADLRKLTRGGTIEQVQTTIEDIGHDLERAAPSSAGAGDKPVLVEVVPDRTPLGDTVQLWPLLEGATTAGLALLLSIFMLIKREDVRNRIVGLAGQAALVTTTKAFLEAGQRISRYLLMQLIINAITGLAIGIGLYFIGVPYAVLWGVAAALLRYVPYVGIWIAAVFPMVLSIVTTPDWTAAAEVLALFLAVELVSGNVLEPWLYGQSVGLSPIAVILAVIFWTWLWGAVGLVLATPLTVCLVVTGKYISGLAIFDQLLGEGTPLQPHLWLYQRLLARDESEAGEVLDEYAAEHTLEQTCEDLLLPTLLVLKHDVASGRIAPADSDFVADALLEIVAELSSAPDDADPPLATNGSAIRLVGLPPSDRLEEIALHLLRLLLARERGQLLEILSAAQLVGERVEAAAQLDPASVCLVSLPPGDLAATRAVSKRLRQRLPDVPILVGRFGATTALAERGRHSLADAGVSQVVDTLHELRDAAATTVRAVTSVAPAEELLEARA
jgi:predicted PurR-regulated permease PerM